MGGLVLMARRVGAGTVVLVLGCGDVSLVLRVVVVASLLVHVVVLTVLVVVLASRHTATVGSRSQARMYHGPLAGMRARAASGGAALYPQNPGMNPTGPLLALSYFAGEALTQRYFRNPRELLG